MVCILVASEALFKKDSGFGSYALALLISVLSIVFIYFFHYFQTHREGASFWNKNVSAGGSVIRNEAWLATGIILLGCFIRLWKLGSLYEGMTFDEAYKGLDAIAIKVFGERPIFLSWNGGREALVAYLVALSQQFSGYSAISVRCISALAGCFTLVFFYLFVRLILSTRVALLSTFLMAVSKWHIIHSRYGVRAGQFTLFEVAALYFLAKGFLSERRNTTYFLLAGLFAGLGFHTYIAFRIFPLVMVAFVVSGQFLRQVRFRWKSLLAGSILCLIILAPLAIYYVNNRASFSDRMNRTLVWHQGGSKNANPVVLTAQSALRTSWLFTYQGDAIARHNVNAEPMLSPYASAFFLLGLVVALASIRMRYVVFLLLWLALNLILGVLSVGAPHAARTLGAIPPTMILTALGILAALHILSIWGRIILSAVLAVVIGGNFYTGINDALFRFPNSLDTLPAALSSLWGMDRDQANVANLINGLGPKCEVYLSPQYFLHSTVEYLTYSKSTHKIIGVHTDLLDETDRNRVAVVILQLHQGNLWWLRDDKGKDFFKWWRENRRVSDHYVHALIHTCYQLDDKYLTRSSDARILAQLRNKFPSGRLINLGHFCAFLGKPTVGSVDSVSRREGPASGPPLDWQ